MPRYCSLDLDGWLIPQQGTKSRAIYDLAKLTNWPPRRIAMQLGTESLIVRVILSRCRHPRRKLGFAEKQKAKTKRPKAAYAGKSIAFTELRECRQNHV